MLNEFQPLKTLINEIKGTTSTLSDLLTRISGLVILFVLLGAVVSQLK